MTIDKKQHQRISALIDGELSRKAATKVRDEIDDNPALQQEVKQIQRVGDLVRTSLDAQDLQPSFDGMWNRIERRIRDERPAPWHERLSVWLREHFSVNRNAWVASLATALLVCAIVIPIMIGRNVPSGAPDPTAPISNEMHVETWESESGEVVVWKANQKTDKQDDDIPVIVHHIDSDDDQKPLPP